MTTEAELLRAEALIDQGESGQALPILQALLRAASGSAAAHHALARAHAARQEVGKALAAAAKAHELAPARPDYAVHLGSLYVDLRLPEHALPLLQKALAAFPATFEANTALGRCYLDMEKGHQALPFLEKAVTQAKDKASRQEASIRLAECLYAINESDRADALLEGLAKTADDPALPIIMRGMNVGRTVPDSLVLALEKIAADLQRPANIRADATLALGRCRDNQGQHIEGFDLWARSRAMLGVALHAQERLDVRNMQTKGFYAKPLFKAAEELGDSSLSPIFVVGMPRSGTTLTAQVIAAHPQCISIGETDRAGKYDAMFRRQHWNQHAHAQIMAMAKQGGLRAIAQEFRQFFGIFAEGGKTRVVEKSPGNIDSLGFIRLVFPKARFVHCRRHPADNFVSAFQHNMNRGHDYAYDQSAYAERYLAQEDIMRYWKSCFPEQIFEVRYEDMVADPEAVTRRLVAFCGLPWDDACLNFHAQKSTVRTFSRDQVRQPVYSTSVERWRRYGARLEPLFAKLNQHGYDYTTSHI